MFAPTAARRNSPNAFASAYRQVGVETGVPSATPHQLVKMLFDGFNDSIAQARLALQRKDVAAKGQAIVRAVRIVEEGLVAALDLDAGGRLADDLLALYSYVGRRLTHANLHNDSAALDECAHLLQPVRSAWIAIGPGAAQAPTAQ